MKTKHTVVVMFYNLSGIHTRTDRFSVPSNAGLWLRVNGFAVNGQMVEGMYESSDGYAIVEYEE